MPTLDEALRVLRDNLDRLARMHAQGGSRIDFGRTNPVHEHLAEVVKTMLEDERVRLRDSLWDQLDVQLANHLDVPATTEGPLIFAVPSGRTFSAGLHRFALRLGPHDDPPVQAEAWGTSGGAITRLGRDERGGSQLVCTIPAPKERARPLRVDIFLPGRRPWGGPRDPTPRLEAASVRSADGANTPILCFGGTRGEPLGDAPVRMRWWTEPMPLRELHPPLRSGRKDIDGVHPNWLRIVVGEVAGHVEIRIALDASIDVRYAAHQGLRCHLPVDGAATQAVLRSPTDYATSEYFAITDSGGGLDAKLDAVWVAAPVGYSAPDAPRTRRSALRRLVHAHRTLATAEAVADAVEGLLGGAASVDSTEIVGRPGWLRADDAEGQGAGFVWEVPVGGDDGSAPPRTNRLRLAESLLQAWMPVGVSLRLVEAVR